MATTKKQLAENSAPVTLLWDRVLMLSIAGLIDSMRAQVIMEAILNKVDTTDSRVVILDILGVTTVDTAVANHIIKITQASRLMGCTCVVCGISPAVAQTLVQLGVPLTDMITRVTMRDALVYSFQLLGLEVKPIAAPLRK